MSSSVMCNLVNLFAFLALVNASLFADSHTVPESPYALLPRRNTTGVSLDSLELRKRQSCGDPGYPLYCSS
jgi:hypothetical protein